MDYETAPHLARPVAGRSAFPLLIRLFVYLLIAVGGVIGHAQTSSSESSSLPRIYDFARYWDASISDVLEGLERDVSLEFTVLYYDHNWNLLWVKEENGTLGFVPIGSDPLALSSGQRLSVSGTVAPSENFDPGVLDSAVVSENEFPDPILLNSEFSSVSRQTMEWVKAEAYVDRQYRMGREHVGYDLIFNSRRVEARVLVVAGSSVPQIEGTFATFEGLVAITPGLGTQAAGMTLWTPGIDLVSSSDSAVSKLFEKPITQLEDLDELPEGVGARIEGEVYEYEKGNFLVLRDQTGQVEIRTQQSSELSPGTLVEVVGYPFLQGSSWTLANAVYRPLNVAAENSFRAVSSSRDSELEIRLAEQVLQLDPKQAERNIPVSIAGVITFADPEKMYLYVNDGTGGIRVNLRKPLVRTIPVGNSVEVSGFTENGDFTPVVLAEELNIAGGLTMPTPRKVTYEQVMTGSEEARWVEMQGHFQYSTFNDDWINLSIAGTTGEFTVRMPAPDNSFSITAGSLLSVRGVCVARSNSNFELVGIDLFVPSLDQVVVKVAAPEDPFESPVSSIENLRRYGSRRMSSQQFKVRGTVLHHVPGRFMFISDGENSLYVLSRSNKPLARGDKVDVVGFPGRIGNHFALRGGVYRETGHGVEPAPLTVSIDLPIDASLHGRVVNLQGQLFDIAVGEEESRMVLQGKGAVIEAILEVGIGVIKESDWQKGATLSVEGIYFVEHDEYGNPSEVSIILRSLDDVKVLKKPSWWSGSRPLYAVGIFAGALALGLFWAGSLRRRVAKQTALIQSQVEEQSLLIEHNKQVFDGASDFIYTLDLLGHFTSFNPAGERITGYTAKEAMDMTIYDLLNHHDARLSRLVLTRQRSKAEEKNLENRITRKDGQLVWVETSVRFVRVNNKPTGMLCIMRDITARKLAEEELKRARDAAEANTKAKSAFFATMSHELRTPMNGVIGMTNILLDTNLNKNQRNYASTVRDSAESLLVLLNDILDLSKAEAGKLTIEPHDFDLKETVGRSAALLEAAANKKGIGLVTEIAPGTPNTLTGDAGRLRQVLLNLAGNAIKFTEKGRVGIAVSKISETDENALVRFEVTDTGIGVSEEAKGRLFNPFEQADGSSSRRFGGTGLGLAICKQIVELMGGEIGVDSVPGQGSTFWFNVCLTKVEGMEEFPAKALKKKSEVKKWTGPAYKILMAEDMPVNQKVTRLQLKKLGLTADLAKNGLEVLEAVKTKQYDIILMDCQMPEMDGFEATEKLRLNSEYAGIHIIALTANAMEGDRRRCLDVGMDDFVSKPTRPAALLAAFERFAEKAV